MPGWCWHKAARMSAPVRWTRSRTSILKMPGDSYAPLVSAIAVTAIFVGLLLLAWWLVAVALAAAAVTAIGWLWPERALGETREPANGCRIALEGTLPVGAIDTRASGWWAMIFVSLHRGRAVRLSAVQLFLPCGATARRRHLSARRDARRWPWHCPNTIILLLSSVAVGWAQFNIQRDDNRRLILGLAVAVVLGIVFLVVQYFEWAEKPFTLSSTAYSSLYIRHHRLPHDACRGRCRRAEHTCWCGPRWAISTACAMRRSISARCTGISSTRCGWRYSSRST